MVTFFCPRCWKDLPGDLPVCLCCGLEIHKLLETTDFVDKLILSLGHPDRMVREEVQRNLERTALEERKGDPDGKQNCLPPRVGGS